MMGSGHGVVLLLLGRRGMERTGKGGRKGGIGVIIINNIIAIGAEGEMGGVDNMVEVSGVGRVVQRGEEKGREEEGTGGLVIEDFNGKEDNGQWRKQIMVSLLSRRGRARDVY